MLDAEIAFVTARRNSIQRYQRLLETRLTELERKYIYNRLLEEELALRTASERNSRRSGQDGDQARIWAMG